MESNKKVANKIDLILKEMIDSFPYTVVVDENGFIVKLSRKYAEFLGVDADKACGRYVAEIIPTSGLPRVLATEQSTIGDIFMLKDGSSIVVSRYPIYQDEKLIGAISTTIFDDLQIVKDLNDQVASLRRENESYRQEIKELRSIRSVVDNIVGETNIIKQLKLELVQMAQTDAGVLITGDTGTGKEVFANAIHYMSLRHNNSYVKINCAAIPSELMESELFGYEDGAFSGAKKSGKPGKFELANKGTILLDEIGEMPLSLQAKLLRVIQEQEVERVGGIRPRKINVRIICSTNRNLEEMVKSGLFRSDLFYRINILELKIPPLCERKEDIPLLCSALIKENNVQDKLSIEGISPEMLDKFEQYSWPGNVRELKHVLERAGIMARTGILNSEHFSFFLQKLEAELEKKKINTSMNPQSISEETNISKKRSMLEKECIESAMLKFKGNKKRVAEYLGISRSTLYEKLKSFSIL